MNLETHELVSLLTWAQRIMHDLWRELTPAELEKVVTAWMGHDKVEFAGMTYLPPKNGRGLVFHYKEAGFEPAP